MNFYNFRLAYELLEAVNEPDIVLGLQWIKINYLIKISFNLLNKILVCCGGDSLLAGISSGLNALGSKAIVYGIEPVTANTMHKSFEDGNAVKMLTAKSIATGLAPPMTG